MALTPGIRVGPYEIAALLGAGGMGEVYRATDLRLKRPVAIKVLPDALAGDPERLARFQREAEVLAALSHPNIAAIHGLEESDGIKAIVMELVEGVTLADRIAHGPLPIDEALPIATQIADALETAHGRGVIHRDLKPANIKVTADGIVKVLDFGLAKLAEDPKAAATSGSASPSLSPTITSPVVVTGVGMLLGTAAYMSPEQARGRAADRRSDIWAFGVVLFEILSGRPAFHGEDVAETLAFVMTRDPDWNALPASTPPALRRLLRRCLQRSPGVRLRDIGDARLELAEAEQEAGTPVVDPAHGSVRPQSRWARALPWSLAVAAGAAAIVTLAIRSPWRTPPAALPLKLEVTAGTSDIVSRNGLALSPDGTTLAFVASPADDPVGNALSRRRIFVRPLSMLAATPLSGTEGAAFPFFSPDGRWLAFFTGGATGQLKKVAVTGGAVVTLCDAPGARGGSWGDDDTIVFASSIAPAPARLMRVPAAGGEPQAIEVADTGNLVKTWPLLLPGGRAVLYTSPGEAGGYNAATILAGPLAGGQPRKILSPGYFPQYLSSGHLAFLRNDVLFAVPFDLNALETTGAAVPVVERVATQAGLGLGVLAVSPNGTLAYQPGDGDASGAGERAPLMWLERTGLARSLRATASAWALPRFSPDGRRVALTIADGRQTDIWVYDWMRDILTRITSDPANDLAPVWTPDGRRLVFGSTRHGRSANLYWQNADGTGTASRLTESDEPQLPDDFHPDGARLILHQGTPAQGRQSLVVLPIEERGDGVLKAGSPAVVVGGPFLKAYPEFSPDGRWLAYVGQESGGFEAYVQPFPGPGPRVQISNDGAERVMWSPTRRELYFTRTSTQAQMMVVRYSLEGETFVAGRPEPWSETRFSSAPPVAAYGPGVDIHPDGERFIVAPAGIAQAQSGPSRLTFVLNFFSELQRLAPAN